MNLADIIAQKNAIKGELARRDIKHFFKLVKPENSVEWHHALILRYLQDFVDKKIKNLIVCVPPQHGKSEICSRTLPAYLLGRFPSKRVISASYNAGLSAKFNRDVQRIITSDNYRLAFPDVTLFDKSEHGTSEGSWIRTSDEFEIVSYGGYYKNAGVGGGITGRTADYAIIDDPIKGAAEAASSTVRQSIVNWYTSDLCTRLNNDSQQLIIMTRWHEQDLVGYILSNPETAKEWTVLTLPAIKEDNRNLEDPRAIGEALWPSFQGIERLRSVRALGERAFQCLYQQNPKANKDVLVYPDFDCIESKLYFEASRPEVLGLDFGFNDELALIGTKTLGDRELWAHEYIYEKGLTPDMLVERLRELGIGKRLLVCDNSRPELIRHLQSSGFAAIPCVKGAGSIFTGIQLVKSYALKITDASDNLIHEANNYEWLTDNRGFATETPKGAKDHALDALRYATKQQASLRGSARPAKYIDMSIE